MAGPLPGEWRVSTVRTAADTDNDAYVMTPRTWQRVTEPTYYGVFTTKAEEPEPTSNELGEIAP